MDRNTKIRGVQIHEDTIPESKLIVNNSPVDGYYLRWNNTAGKLEWAVGSNAVTETPSGAINGVNTSYTLTYTPLSGSVLVFLNGLLQEEGSGKDYTLSGTTVTFTTAPATGDIIIVSYLREASGSFVGADTYTVSFTDGDLSSAGVLVVNHGLSKQYVNATVYDNNDKKIIPDEETATDSNTLTVDLSSFGTLSGTWNIRVVA